METNNKKAWLYLLPAGIFLAVFMVYPLIDVFIYSMEESYNFASQTSRGTGLFNFNYILHDPYFLQAVRNTALCVAITVPISTGLSLLIAFGLSSIKALKNLFQTIYFLPYVTNTLAVGLVFMILFKKTAYTDGMVNLLIHFFHGPSVDLEDLSAHHAPDDLPDGVLSDHHRIHRSLQGILGRGRSVRHGSECRENEYNRGLYL